MTIWLGGERWCAGLKLWLIGPLATCPAAAAWVCSILQLQASRGQGVPGCSSGAADSKSMDSRCPRPAAAAAANLLPGVLQRVQHSTALHTGDPFKVQNRPAAAAEPSVGFA